MEINRINYEFSKGVSGGHLSPEIYSINWEEPIWGADNLDRLNAVLDLSAKFAGREDFLYYVFAYGGSQYLVGVADNFFTAKLMGLIRSPLDYGWITYGDFYGTNVLKVPKEDKFQFSFDWVYKNHSSRYAPEEFYKGLDCKGLTEVRCLSGVSFECSSIPENPFRYIDKDDAEWTLAGYYSNKEIEFIKKYVFPLYTDRFGNSILKIVNKNEKGI